MVLTKFQRRYNEPTHNEVVCKPCTCAKHCFTKFSLSCLRFFFTRGIKKRIKVNGHQKVWFTFSTCGMDNVKEITRASDLLLQAVQSLQKATRILHSQVAVQNYLLVTAMAKSHCRQNDNMFWFSELKDFSWRASRPKPRKQLQ